MYKHMHMKECFLCFFMLFRHAWSSSCAGQTIPHLFEDLRFYVLKEYQTKIIVQTMHHLFEDLGFYVPEEYQTKIILHVCLCSWTCECLRIANMSWSWNVKIDLVEQYHSWCRIYYAIHLGHAYVRCLAGVVF